jgi:CelD/BcsL family acetyltransferase involved in cellulose biosynthesis
LIVHAAVAEYLARQGVRTYDFMAGSSQYKRSLATDRFPVYWVRVERKNIKTTIIALATQVKKLLKSMLQVAKVR